MYFVVNPFKMNKGYQRALILCSVSLLFMPIVRPLMEFSRDTDNAKEADENAAFVSDDEISYALSDLSVDDLNALSQLLDVINEHDDGGEENNIKNLLSSEELARFKRENSDNPSQDDQGVNSVPNQDDEYIRQLDESFPNLGEQLNQDDKEKSHIRVKRS